MKMKYVKPEMAIETVEIETAILEASSLSNGGLGTSGEFGEAKMRDFESDDASSKGWEDGLW